MGNGFPCLSEANEFLPVDAGGICENTTSVDDGDGFVIAEKNLICNDNQSFSMEKFLERMHTGSEVSIRTTSLNLGDVLLSKSELFVNSEHILSN